MYVGMAAIHLSGGASCVTMSKVVHCPIKETMHTPTMGRTLTGWAIRLSSIELVGGYT